MKRLFQPLLRAGGAASFTLLVGLSALTVPAQACRFVQPPPACAKTIFISPSVPEVLVVPPGGGVIGVQALVFFKMFESPGGSGICPEPPFLADLDLVLDCDTGSDGTGSVEDILIDRGRNLVTVPVTVGDGPSRQCDLGATVTLTLADGMVLTNDSTVPACLGEEVGPRRSGGAPRVDMRILDASGDLTGNLGVNPAGGSAFTVIEITNNDASAPLTGELTLSAHNVSGKLPGMSGPQPTGTGVFTITANVGDHFNFAAADALELQHCPEPGDVYDPAPPTERRSISIAAGETSLYEYYVRSPDGLCPDGSCSRFIATLDGSLGPDPAVACGSVNVLADRGIPPNDPPCSGGGAQLIANGDGFLLPKAGDGQINADYSSFSGGIAAEVRETTVGDAGAGDGQFYYQSFDMVIDDVLPRSIGIDARIDLGFGFDDPLDGFGAWTIEALPPAADQPYGSNFVSHADFLWDGNVMGDVVFKHAGLFTAHLQDGTSVFPSNGFTEANSVFSGTDFLDVMFFDIPAPQRGVIEVAGFQYTSFINGYFRPSEPVSRSGFEDPPDRSLD